MNMIAISSLVVLLAGLSTAQILPGFIPPMLPAQPFSPLALPPTTFGFGLGALSLGFPFMPFFRPFPFFGGLNPNFRRTLGKRSVDDVVTPINKAFCTFETLNSTIRCTGSFETFECGVETRLESIKGITMKLPTLGVVPEKVTLKSTPTDVLRLYSRIVDSNCTFTTPRELKPVTLAIFSTPELTEPGFFVKDTTCWSKFFNVVNTTITQFSLCYTA